jgi:gluconokinase
MGAANVSVRRMVVLLMGVSGAGKTTVGKLLASEVGWEFADADDYHPAANVEKMRNGIPLTDADRGPWLERLRAVIVEWIAAGKNGVLACSALKKAYRDMLVVGPEVRVVYLKADREVLRERLLERHGHYMKEGLLESQLATLEEPEDAIVVDAGKSPEENVLTILRSLRRSGTMPRRD